MPSELRDAYINTRNDLLPYRYGWHSVAIRAAILTVLPDEPSLSNGAESEMIRHDERCRIRSRFLELADALTNQQEQADGEEEEPNHAPTDWCWDPLPAISGWFAVLRGWEPEEGLFPGAAWVEAGQVQPPHDNGVARDGSGHAGPFATEAEALAWAKTHDPEDPSWRGSHA